MPITVNRLRGLRIHISDILNLIVSMIPGKAKVIMYTTNAPGNLPSDCVYVQTNFDWKGMALVVILSHASFDIVMDGHPIPTYDLTITT